MSKTIAQVVVGLPLEGPFDYFVPESLRDQISVGKRVAVLFNHTRRLGIVVGFIDQSAFPKLNPILKILDTLEPSVDERLLKLGRTFSSHYGCSLGEALELFLAPKLRTFAETALSPASQTKLNKFKPKTSLIHHLSFTKQWDAIASHIKETLDANQNVLVLTPERHFIEEIEQKLAGFKDTFISFKSDLSQPEELSLWEQARIKEKTIIIGTRSCVFTPVPDLGTIIILSEEDRSYKQEQSPAYHAETVSLMRQQLEGVHLIYTSFTPRLEVWQKFSRKSKDKIFITDEISSTIQIVDMSNYNPRKSSLVSFPLQNQLQKTLEAKEKAILLFNRKGFSTFTVCNQCGHVVKCSRCQVNLVYSYTAKKLICRYCGHLEDLPKICPLCKSSYVRSVGTGIEKIESELARIYPQARIYHLDRELDRLPEQYDILIATQAVLKYLSKLHPAIIAVIDYDRWSSRGDFRSPEETLGMLVRMRIAAKQKLILQTRHRDDLVLKTINDLNFSSFYRQELKERKEAYLPPFCQILEIHLRSVSQEDVQKQSMLLFEKLKTLSLEKTEILDPFPDILPKLRDKYRYVIVIKTDSLDQTLPAIKKITQEFKRKSKIIVTLDVDS